jgi:S-adenosylmethionine hydrolase
MICRTLVVLALLSLSAQAAWARAPLVFYTDFGTADGAVSAMKGVAYGVSRDILISDLSHEDPGSIFAGAYRLYQAESFWPRDTVFVVVIDPGVGTERLSIALKTRTGHIFLAPNNGLLTLVAERDGVEELRRIDETTNRRPGSEESHTFHGRDIFGYAGARLAADVITFEEIGPKLPPDALLTLPYRKAERVGEKITGNIPVLDTQYGNVWTNIPKALFDELKPELGQTFRVRFYREDQLISESIAPYRRTFGEVPRKTPLIYVNSLLDMAIALNLGNFAREHGVGSGPEWTIEISRE